MRKLLKGWQIAGFIFTGIFGVLLHFAYDLSGESIIIAPFAAVDESIFQHMKLLYFPALIYAVSQGKFLVKNYRHFWWVKLFGILLGIFLIPILYYTYTGALGVSADWFNIAIFFIAAAFMYLIEKLLFTKDISFPDSSVIPVMIIVIMGIIFVMFTFAPPKIPLFCDAATGSYGI